MNRTASSLAATTGDIAAEPAEQRGSDAATPSQARSMHEKRLSRAIDCMENALKADDPFQASLGAMTGSLMLTTAQLDAAIQNKLASNDPTLESFLQLADSLELHLKLARQVERHYQLIRRQPEKKPPHSRAGDRP